MGCAEFDKWHNTVANERTRQEMRGTRPPHHPKLNPSSTHLPIDNPCLTHNQFCVNVYQHVLLGYYKSSWRFVTKLSTVDRQCYVISRKLRTPRTMPWVCMTFGVAGDFHGTTTNIHTCPKVGKNPTKRWRGYEHAYPLQFSAAPHFFLPFWKSW